MIRGIVLIRIVAFVLGAGCVLSAPWFLVSISDINGASDYAAILLVIVLPLGLGGAYCIVKSLEYLRITEDAMEIRNPVRPRSIPWEAITEVQLSPDVITVVPVVRTTAGKVIKLRCAASFTQREGSAAQRACVAIREHISGPV